MILHLGNFCPFLALNNTSFYYCTNWNKKGSVVLKFVKEQFRTCNKINIHLSQLDKSSEHWQAHLCFGIASCKWFFFLTLHCFASYVVVVVHFAGLTTYIKFFAFLSSSLWTVACFKRPMYLWKPFGLESVRTSSTSATNVAPQLIAIPSIIRRKNSSTFAQNLFF